MFQVEALASNSGVRGSKSKYSSSQLLPSNLSKNLYRASSCFFKENPILQITIKTIEIRKLKPSPTTIE